MIQRMLLPFDAHNHVQLGPTKVVFSNNDLPQQTILSVAPPRTSSGGDVVEREGGSSCGDERATLSNDDLFDAASSGGPVAESFSQNEAVLETSTVSVTTSEPTLRTESVCLSSFLSGMAVMGTHPRDFPRILQMRQDAMELVSPSSAESRSSPSKFQVIACLGVHPWFLHELHDHDWELVEPQNPSLFIPSLLPDSNEHHQQQQGHSKNKDGCVPRWVSDIEQHLILHPDCPVGEIGLDGFHFDPTTKDLTTSMDEQADSFMYQLQLATVYERPVSVHCVRATGKIMDVLNHVYQYNNKKNKELKKKNKLKRVDDGHINDDDGVKNQPNHPLRLLPPRIYFHAFGGKAATVKQLIQTLERRGNKGKETATSTTTKCFFGFAPIINFESHKTTDVIKAVGLDRLVLETDHEDAARVESSMKMGVRVISDALSVSKEELIRVTNANARELYQLAK
mmetsp:Transcript_39294/g.95030  ORF Transcript_39294/g.95030 Transcript_39294/m.95030 type:complete len:454 (-) Transcript_39294:373-1734(-)